MDLNAQSRVMVFAAHPDDETLATGGLIQRALAGGAAVRVIFVTSGENNPWPQRVLERRWRIGPAEREGWARRRRGEALEALECLGVTADAVEFMGYPDQGLTRLLLAEPDPWARALADRILPWRPTWVVGPSMSDGHADHSALAVGLDLARRLGAANGQPTWRTATYWVHGRPAEHETPDALRLDLTSDEVEAKRRALLCHRSQLALSRGRFMRHIEPSEWFAPADAAQRWAEHPVRFAREHGEEFTIKLEPASRLPGRRRLVLLRESGNASQALEVRLPRWLGGGAEASIRTAADGALVSQAFCQRRPRGMVVRLPMRLLAGAERLAVKLEEPTIFFDHAGWRLVPPPKPTPPAKPAGGRTGRRTTRHATPAGEPHTVAVVPCYNVAQACEGVIRETARHAERVIVVDDGSRDGTGAILDRLAAELGDAIVLLRFPRNRGKGVALLEAFRHVVRHEACDVLITIDADGQHRPSDIPALAERCLANDADLVIGTRLDPAAMPPRSRVGNALVSRLLGWIYPGCPSDSQSGLRAHRGRFVRRVAERLEGRRYETEMKILLMALHSRLRIESVEVPTLYFDGNRSSHFRPLLDSIAILWTVLASRFQRSPS